MTPGPRPGPSLVRPRCTERGPYRVGPAATEGDSPMVLRPSLLSLGPAGEKVFPDCVQPRKGTAWKCLGNACFPRDIGNGAI